nr:hypothetical protein [Nostoc sp. DedSLP05]
VDSADLVSATVSITSGFVSAQDILSFTNQNGISGSYNSSTGVLTLTGTATVANYQTALRSITYTNSSDNPTTTPRTISFVVNDGTANSTPVTRNINITAVNDAPVATATNSALVYTNNTTIAIDSGISLSDVDSANLSSATVSINSGFISSEDILNFTNQNGISGSYNSSTGVLTLTGNASVANYQTALRSITYSNSSNNPSTTPRIISFVVNDGTANSTAVSRNLNITAANNPPIATVTNSALTYTENTTTTIDSGIILKDVDSANLSSATVSITSGFVSGQDILGFTNQNGITGSYNSSTGVLTLTGNATVANYQAALRSVTYTNSSDNPITTRTISFVVNDGTANSTAVTRNLNITALNDKPVATTTNSAVAYTENATIAIDSGIILGDVDSLYLSGATIKISSGFVSSEDILNFTNQNGIKGSYNRTTGILTLSGTATVADYQTALRSITYANSSDKPTTTPRTISFVVDDGNFDSIPVTRNINITPVNDAPATATNLALNTNNTTTAIDSGISLRDVDSDNLSSATISISSGFISSEDTLNFTNQSGIIGNYNRSTGILTLTGTATVANYQTALRSITYTNSSNNPISTRTISFVVNDGTANSTAVTRNLNITPVNNAPAATATNSAVAYTENNTIAIDSGIILSDVDSANLSSATVSITSGFVSAQDILAFSNQNGISGNYNSSTGVLTLTGTATVANYQAALRSITYTNSSENPSITTRTISFVVNDGTADSTTVTRNINITAVSDAPVVAATNSALAYTENATTTVIDSLISLSDVDSTNLVSAIVRISSGLVSSEDTLSFASKNGISGSYNSSTGVLTLTGTATVANYQTALRSITYTNSSNNPSTTTRTVRFIVNDGAANSIAVTRDINITAVNDVPVAATTNSDLEYTKYPYTKIDSAIDSGIIISDVDSANLSSAIVRISSGFVSSEDTLNFTNQNGITGRYISTTGILTLIGNATVANYQTALRSITYTNSSNNPSTTPRTISFVVSDGTANSTAATRNLNITAANNPSVIISESSPVATATNSTVPYIENATTAIDSGIILSDVDSANLVNAAVAIGSGFVSSEDTLNFTNQNGIIGSYNSGVLILIGTTTVANYQTALRSITYTNSSNNPSTTPRIISFVVNDGTTNSTVVTRNINITPVNDAPVAIATKSALAYTENATTTIDSGIILGDADSANLVSATVSISSGFVSGEDSLNFSNQNGITGSYNSSTGVLTLTGTATVADYQTALRSITYTNSSDNSSVTRTISFVVNDGAFNSNAVTRNINITPVNDAPVATATNSPLTYTENATTAIDSGIILSDVDSANLVSATVSISSGFVSSEDILKFTNQNGIIGNYNSSTGVLTLTGTATVANYQTALRSITYNNSSENPTTTPRSISFIVNDGTANSTAVTRNINVTAVNDPLVVVATNSALAYTENATTAIDSGIILSDVDLPNLFGASVRITNGFVSNEDILNFTNQNGIT